MIKKIKYHIEYIILLLFFYLFKILGLKISVFIASNIAKFIGKFLTVNKLAKKNITLSNLNKSKKEVDTIVHDMWSNIGSNIAEMPNLDKINSDNFLISQNSKKNIDEAMKFKNGVIFISAHIGNWELLAVMIIDKIKKFNVFYKKLNNQMVNNLLIKIRNNKNIKFIEKSRGGNKEILKIMKQKSYFGILIDLYISKGQKINFLGRDTNSTQTAAKLSLKYNKPIVPIYCKRIGPNSKFEFIAEKPIDFKKTENTLTENDLTIKINKVVESWITQNPEQWFWVHDRWKNK